MPKTLSVGPQEKGHKWASSGFGNEAGTFWKPGEYLLSCEVNGTVITQAAFRVTDASIFFLERHKTVNVAALVMTEGLAGNPHWYLGELRVTHNGIEWHESYKWLDRAFGPRWIEISKSTADFQAACGSFKIGLDSRTLRGKKADVITVIQGNQTMELATDVGEGERVVAGVRDGCSTR